MNPKIHTGKALFVAGIFIATGLVVLTGIKAFGNPEKRLGKVLGETLQNASTTDEFAAAILQSEQQATTTPDTLAGDDVATTTVPVMSEPATTPVPETGNAAPVQTQPAATAAQASFQNSAPAQITNTGTSPREIITPEGLDIGVIREGTGMRAATMGDTVKIYYVEKMISDYHQLDPTSSGNGPYIFQLGSDKVIPGWNHGIVGMKEGEVRQILIPANEAYGDAGNEKLGIPPNTTLTLRVKLLKIN